RLGKALYKRGRIPDMKKWRVLASASVLIALVLFVFLVPVPVSRIRGQALVMADPSATGKVYVHRPGILTKLNVRPGDNVEEGEEIAVFRDPDLEDELLKAEMERDDASANLKFLKAKFDRTNEVDEKSKITQKIAEVDHKRIIAAAQVRSWQK